MKKILLQRCGVSFKVETMSPLISEKLIENNFLSHFVSDNFLGYPTGDYIGYRQHTEFLDSEEIAEHLKNEWLSDEKLSITPDLKNAIVSKIFEIFMNAYGHGAEKSDLQGIGVVSCGQYDKKQGKLKLSVLDFGIGIIDNVKKHINENLNDIEAMRWALKTGNSTKTDSLEELIPRGLGFGLLNEFVSLNKGEFSVFSNTCCAHVNAEGKYDVSTMKIPFRGTMVSISINCDDRHYKFISESTSEEQYF